LTVRLTPAAVAGVAALGLAVLASCIRQEAPESAPLPAAAVAQSPEPQVRIGLQVGATSVTIGGAAALTVTEPDGTPVARIAPGEAWRVVIAGQALQLISPTGRSTAPAEAVSIVPEDQNDAVRAGRRDYRGTLDILRDRTGLSVINRIGLEAYLGGVVGGEMGRRDSSEMEALRAQAVVSRTYALRNMGRWRAEGFDFQATVADQVYGGVQGENPLAMQAVRETRGQVITAGGAPIDAFFFSTCGGHTADGTEAFRGAERPYLRSIADVDAAGVAYCSISPRYHWRDEWSGDALRSVLTRTLHEAGLVSGALGRIRNVAADGRTASGRVARLAISTSTGTISVDGPRIRRVLATTNGEILRSNVFELTVSTRGGSVSRLVADGMGAGHGVGMCQWGAVGRARAGQRYADILAAYFQGTQLQRYY
jgi:stage II sporulation protein D